MPIISSRTPADGTSLRLSCEGNSTRMYTREDPWLRFTGFEAKAGAYSELNLSEKEVPVFGSRREKFQMEYKNV